MIYFLTLLTSLCIQFCAVDLPYKVNEFEFIDSVKSYLNNYTGAPQEFYWFANNDVPYIVQRFSLSSDGSGAYNVYFPIENYNTSVSSSIIVDNFETTPGYDGYRGQFTFHNFYGCQFLINSDGSYVTLNGGFNQSSSVTFNYFFPDDLAIGSYSYGRVVGLYDYYIYNGSDLILFNDTSLSLSGHTQDGKNDKIIDALPFPNAPTITGHSSVSSVDDTNTNNLLGNILNILQVVGNTITNTGNNIITFISNLYGNINDTINYVIEPFNTEEAIDIMKNSHFNGLFEDLKNVKDTFDNLSNSDHVILSFTLPAYLGGDTFQFDFAQYFNSSKHIWQPLLLTFLYASLVWGFYKGFANLVNGSSPFVSDVHYQFANDRLQREQASANHTR